MWRSSCLALAALSIILTPFAAPAQGIAENPPAAQCSSDRVLVRQDNRVLSFHVEVADTPGARERGLMFRQSLPRGEGMLFIYDHPQRVSFWMRNTLIPLDMVFIDAAGIIRHIHGNARPLDETSIPGAAVGDPDPERLMVLEIAGGEAARLGLERGQAIAHPALAGEEVAWPCA